MLLSLAANLAWGLGLLVSMSFVATVPILPQGSWLAAWIADGLLMTLSVAIVLFILIRNLIAAVSTEISLST